MLPFDHGMTFLFFFFALIHWCLNVGFLCSVKVRNDSTWVANLITFCFDSAVLDSGIITTVLSLVLLTEVTLAVSFCWCFKPSQPQRMRETFIKQRYIVERTNNAEIRPEEQ